MHVLVIGAYGSAGAVVAEQLADEGVRVTLADDGDPGGGLCILRGCMPSKELLSAAAHRFQVRHDDRLGDPPSVDLEATIDRKDAHTSAWARHRREAVAELADREHVTFRRDRARFVPDGVRVGEEIFDPDYVVVATGSVPDVPAIPGIEAVDYWTSADVLDARSLPDSAVVMGFGYVGLELVPYLSELGVDVTVIEHDRRPLDEADPAFGDAAQELYREAFDVEILTEVYEERVEPTAEGVRLHLDDGTAVEAERLCCFTGRRPNVDGLGLEQVGLAPELGWVDETMQARDAEGVFVVGDANGIEPILHVAKDEGEVAAENVLRHAAGEPLVEYQLTPHHVVFSGAGVYPYARVGHTEASAEAAGIEHVCVTRLASDDGVFAAKAVPEGLASLVVGTDGTVLGFQGLHYHADAMAKTAQVLVELGTDVRDVPDRAYHPTTPEIMDGLFAAATRALVKGQQIK